MVFNKHDIISFCLHFGSAIFLTVPVTTLFYITKNKQK